MASTKGMVGRFCGRAERKLSIEFADIGAMSVVTVEANGWSVALTEAVGAFVGTVTIHSD